MKQVAQKNGLLCYPMSGTIDGKHGDHILLAPTFINSETEMDLLIDKLSKSLNEANASLNKLASTSTANPEPAVPL